MECQREIRRGEGENCTHRLRIKEVELHFLQVSKNATNTYKSRVLLSVCGFCTEAGDVDSGSLGQRPGSTVFVTGFKCLH